MSVLIAMGREEFKDVRILSDKFPAGFAVALEASAWVPRFGE